jgi:hypothetical protein
LERIRAVHPLYRSVELARPRVIAGAMKTALDRSHSRETQTLVWVSGVALTVLLIVPNVANLLLARALRRRREMALRLALGVSRPIGG